MPDVVLVVAVIPAVQSCEHHGYCVVTFLERASLVVGGGSLTRKVRCYRYWLVSCYLSCDAVTSLLQKRFQSSLVDDLSRPGQQMEEVHRACVTLMGITST